MSMYPVVQDRMICKYISRPAAADFVDFTMTIPLQHLISFVTEGGFAERWHPLWLSVGRQCSTPR
jgi:hypothetical protein